MRKKITIFLFILLFIIVIYNIVLVIINYFNNISFSEKINRSKNYKIGILYESDTTEEIINGFKDGMFDLGYSDNKNIFYNQVEINSFTSENIEQEFKELSEENVDLIYTVMSPVTEAAHTYFKSKPIVFNISISPITAGFSDSYSTSGDNITGFTSLSDELSPKRLEIFKNSFPSLKRVTIIYDSTNKFIIPAVVNTRQIARKIGLEIDERQVSNVQVLTNILSQIIPGMTDGFFMVPDSLVINNIDLFIKRANELRIPIMVDSAELVKRGATISYGANYYEIGKRSALSVSKILSGIKAKQLPIETPNSLELVVNLKNLRNNNLVVNDEIINLVSYFIE